MEYSDSHTPSAALHQQIRAAFVLQGTSLSRWCSENGIDPRNARQAIYGSWNGPRGRALRARIIAAARLNERAA